VTEASIYKWKANFGDMDVSEAKQLRALEDENDKLKQMLANTMLTTAPLHPGAARDRGVEDMI
jgi:putative transposase